MPHEGELVVRDLQPRGNLLVGLGAPRLQARAQVRKFVGDDEDQDGLRERLLDLQRAVDFGFGDDVEPGRQRLLDERARRAVQVPVILAPFEEVARAALPLELVPRQKEVVYPVPLARPRAPRRRGDRVEKPLVPRLETLDERVFPRTGRA